MPTDLRLIFYNNPQLLGDLMKKAQKTMDEVMAESKNKSVKLGYIVVLQTAGRDATYNPHLHCLITNGGLTEEGNWVPLGYPPRGGKAHYSLRFVTSALAREPIINDNKQFAK